MNTPKKDPQRTTSTREAGTSPRSRGRARAGRATSPSAGRVHAEPSGVASFAVPGVALLATSFVAAAGYMVRQRLGNLVTDALQVAVHEATRASRAGSEYADEAREGVRNAVERILHAAGLEHRRPVASALLPVVGVACGFVAGAVLTYFYAPRILEQLGLDHAPANDAKATEPNPDPAPARTDGMRANGGASAPMV